MKLVPITPDAVINLKKVESVRIDAEDPFHSVIQMTSGNVIQVPLDIKNVLNFLNEFYEKEEKQQVVRTVSEFAG